MKTYLKALTIFTMFPCFFLSMCTEQEYRISINFSNPQNKPIKHAGYYTLLSTDDSTSMNDYTPSEYVIFLVEGDTLIVCARLDTMTTDTLFLDIYVDGMPELDRAWLGLIEVYFRYPPESASAQ